MNYNAQGYRIVDVSAERIAACAAFKYKGHEISFSQIFRNDALVMVFKEGRDNAMHECYTVQEAIAWVDAQGETK